MKPLGPIVLSAALAAAALLVAPSARGECPPNMVELDCAGSPKCETAGAFCCGANACASDQICLRCENVPLCAAAGATCCGAVMCPPGQECTTCGTETGCRPRGEGCPIDDMD